MNKLVFVITCMKFSVKKQCSLKGNPEEEVSWLRTVGRYPGVATATPLQVYIPRERLFIGQAELKYPAFLVDFISVYLQLT